MNIINILNFQLAKIEKVLKEELKQRQLTYNYFIYEDHCTFLDKYKLQSYLTENKIENLKFLKSINEKCANIIKLWNVDFKNIPDKRFKEPFIYSNIEKERVVNTILDFHAIIISKNKWYFHTTRQSKLRFVEEYNFKKYSICEIASRCSIILNWITSTYPKTETGLHPEFFLHQYLEHKSFSFRLYIKPFAKDEFEKINRQLENYEFRYWYIFSSSKLNDSQRLEFKYDNIDHLKKFEKAQILSKYKVLFKEVIERIQSIDDPKSLMLQQTIGRQQVKPVLTIKELALKYVYEGKSITRKNGDEIAKEHGHNSGEKLFQEFTHYSSTANRKAKPTLCTPRKLRNKIQRFEKVIKTLPDKYKSKAIDEVKTLKTIYENEYQ